MSSSSRSCTHRLAPSSPGWHWTLTVGFMLLCALDRTKWRADYFRGLLQFMNIFQHEIISHAVTCEIQHWNNLEIILVFYFTCNVTTVFLTFGHSGVQGWAPQRPNVRNTVVTWEIEIVSKLFQNNVISHVTASYYITNWKCCLPLAKNALKFRFQRWI